MTYENGRLKEKEKLRIIKEAEEKKKNSIKHQKQKQDGAQGLSFSKDDEIEFLKDELNKLKLQVSCSSCEKNPK